MLIVPLLFNYSLHLICVSVSVVYVSVHMCVTAGGLCQVSCSVTFTVGLLRQDLVRGWAGSSRAVVMCHWWGRIEAIDFGWLVI